MQKGKIKKNNHTDATEYKLNQSGELPPPAGEEETTEIGEQINSKTVAIQ